MRLAGQAPRLLTAEGLCRHGFHRLRSHNEFRLANAFLAPITGALVNEVDTRNRLAAIDTLAATTTAARSVTLSALVSLVQASPVMWTSRKTPWPIASMNSPWLAAKSQPKNAAQQKSTKVKRISEF
ncbi:hypothetical protein LB535_08090 [Mesorhizobium sp. CA10]|uniref:hypothetical protein n=1 Tax=Mesorhizobium sp. CA10 TaxID=588495 RepID=UPI001CC951F0|nr:hypothetical protein [Mesorhizobium sp. CA10]MBZ9882309.1 hypothetical protein [Mesorhizobium sp. CA10]